MFNKLPAPSNIMRAGEIYEIISYLPPTVPFSPMRADGEVERSALIFVRHRLPFIICSTQRRTSSGVTRTPRPIFAPRNFPTA